MPDIFILSLDTIFLVKNTDTVFATLHQWIGSCGIGTPLKYRGLPVSSRTQRRLWIGLFKGSVINLKFQQNRQRKAKRLA